MGHDLRGSEIIEVGGGCEYGLGEVEKGVKGRGGDR